MAAIFLAINTFHIAKSQVIEVDVPLTFFIMLTFFFMMKLMEKPVRRNYILTGVAMGLAVSTKYTAAILLFPVIVAHIMAQRTYDGENRAKTNRRKRKRLWISPLYVLITALIVFLVTSPFILFDAPTFFQHLSLEREHMSIGHFGLEKSGTWLFYVKALAGRLLGWPISLVALAGLVYLAGVKRRRWAIVSASFLMPLLIVVSSWAVKADRYIIPIMPLAILFAIFQTIQRYSSENRSSPIITVYSNPRHKIPFGGRRRIEEPLSLDHGSWKASGKEEFFYLDFGRNYESFRYYKEAIFSYELGLLYPISRPEVHSRPIMGKTGCLVILRKNEEAAEFLRTAARTVPVESDRQRFLKLRQKILSRIGTKTNR